MARVHARIDQRRERFRGSASVETAVVLPLLMLLGIGATDLGTFSYANIYVASAAANGAQYGSTSITAAYDSTGIQQAALLDQTGFCNAAWTKFANDYDFTSSNPTVTSSVHDEGSGKKSVEVTVSYVFLTRIGYPGLPRTLTLVHTVRMPVKS